MTIEEILSGNYTNEEIISMLKKKAFNPPSWSELSKEYNPRLHPIYEEPNYRDVVNEDNSIDKVTRICFDLQRLATKRMTELVFGIPVKRVYHSENEDQQKAAKVIESIYERNRIDNVNIERGNMLFAGCEFMTLWYAVEEKNAIYGVPSDIKIRCRNFSPMKGDKLYPLFDEFGDYIAMSVEYNVNEGDLTTTYFDTYTKDKHIKFILDNGWQKILEEKITIGKNPTLYCVRRTPIWENTSDLVYEMEWAMSRNGNYLRKNSKPVWVVCANEEITYGKEQNQDKEFRSILQYPAGSTAGYVTWNQAIENLKFYIQELRTMFFTQLQLPDWSYDNMKAIPMSGEARKQMFIDAQLKVKDESGRILELLDREVNVVKVFAKVIVPNLANEIDKLQVESIITPFSINDESETIQNIVTATGGKQIISQRQAIELLGWSNNAEETLKQIAEESAINNSELAL